MELKVGQLVRLYGPKNEPLDSAFKVLQVCNDDTVRLISTKNKFEMRVHKSRIIQEEQKPLEQGGKNMNEAEEKKVEQKVEKKVEEKEEKKEEKVEKKPEPPKATAPKVKKEKKPKDKRQPFDLGKWVAGNEHWTKGSATYDHKHIKLVAHISIDEKSGFYHTINTYRYPDNVLTANGGNKFPLKGHSPLVTKSKNGEKVVRRGVRTAEELREYVKKQGYKKV